MNYKFDEEGTRELVIAWQRTRNQDVFAEILKRVQPMIDRLIGKRGMYQYVDVQELSHIIHIKIWDSLVLYNPLCGSKIYSFFTCLINNKISQSQIDSSKIPIMQSIDISDSDSRCDFNMHMNRISEEAYFHPCKDIQDQRSDYLDRQL